MIKLQLCLKFANCISDDIFSGICDLEHYLLHCNVEYVLRRKMKWPQSLLSN